MERSVQTLLNGFIVAVALSFSACSTSKPVVACAPLPPAPAAAKPAPPHIENQPRVPDEYLVTLAPNADKKVIFEFYASFGIKDVYALGGETFLLVLQNDPGPQKMESMVDSDERIMMVQPNLIYWKNRSGSITK